MEKQKLFQIIADMTSHGSLSKEELLSAYDAGFKKRDANVVDEKTSTFVKILYYIGGGVIVIGLVVLIQQNWFEFDSITRVIVTLGTGIGMFISAIFLQENKAQEKRGLWDIADAFHLVGALLVPTGMYVFVHEYADTNWVGTHSVIMGALFAGYMMAYHVYRRTILLLSSIIFGSLFYFAYIGYVIGDHVMAFDPFRFTMYEFAVLGLAYIFLGLSFVNSKREVLTGILYGFGSLAFLGSTLSLGGWDPDAYIFWELSYPAIVFAFIFLSVYLRSKTFLVFGSLFFMGYIIKITAEYFAETTGWPLALIVVGFALMGIGYLTFYLNKRYLSRR